MTKNVKNTMRFFVLFVISMIVHLAASIYTMWSGELPIDLYATATIGVVTMGLMFVFSLLGLEEDDMEVANEVFGV